MDDNNFISGSIDGKLRIWEVHGGRVIDWTDFKEIVTAVGYRPDGKVSEIFSKHSMISRSLVISLTCCLC